MTPVVDLQRLEGVSNVYASPVGAEGRIYLTSREGTTVVFESGKFEKDGDKNQVAIIATNKLDDSFDASAAIAGPDLFLRGGKNLYCIGAE